MALPTLLWCCGIGFVIQFVDNLYVAIDRPLRQALHDKTALTVVVKVRHNEVVEPDSHRRAEPHRESEPHRSKEGEST
jgi:hypothetical protein